MNSPTAKSQVRDEETWKLRLYIAGMTPTARRTMSNLKRICEAYLATGYTLDVVDLLDDPQQAEDNQIIAVPTLVRELPAPLRKLIGDLSDTERVLTGLSLGLSSLPLQNEK